MSSRPWSLKKSSRILIAGIVFIAFAILSDTVFRDSLERMYLNRKMDRIRQALTEREKGMDALLKLALVQTPGAEENYHQKLINKSRQEGIGLYIFRNNNIAFWTSNSVFPVINSNNPNSFLLKLGNGYYLQKNINQGLLSCVCLCPVQFQFAFENKYLHNDLALVPTEDFDIKVLDKETPGAFPFYNKNGQFIFALQAHGNDNSFAWLAWSFMAGAFLCFIFLHSLLNNLLHKQKNVLAILVMLGAYAAAILLWRVFRLPASMYSWPIFSAKYYASNALFPSLGDLMICTFLLAYLCWFLTRLRLKIKLPDWFKIIFICFAILFLYIASSSVVWLIKGLILDSIISFDLSNIFSLNSYSILGLLIIATWMVCLLIGSFSISHKLYRLFPNTVSHFSILILIGLLSIALIIPRWEAYWGAPVYMFILLAGLFLYRDDLKPRTWLYYVAFVLLSGTFITSVVARYNIESMTELQHISAARLVRERDATAEFLFENIYESLQQDEYIKNYFLKQGGTERNLLKRIQELYFSGYFSKYDVDINTFSPQGLPFSNLLDRPLNFYQNIIKNRASPVLPEKLFFINSYSGLPSYRTVIPIYRDDFFLGTLHLRLQQKAFYEESVYPELLLAENLQPIREINNFSYAVYNNRNLFTQKGGFPYPATWTKKLVMDSSGIILARDQGYTHFIQQINPNLMVVVSAANKTWLYYVSIFSFLLIFFLLVYTIIRYLPQAIRNLEGLKRRNVIRFFTNNQIWNRLSFRNKIFATVLSGMTIALLLIGFTTVRYIIYQYNKDELDKLRKKTRFITSKLSSESHINDRLSPITDEEMSGLIKNLSENNQADINVFDLQGSLIASTQNIIYEKLIIGPKMDPHAFDKFVSGNATQIIQEEEIGKLHYTSSYMLLRDALGNVIGFLNIPYFSKEQDLKDHISSFLVALVNIYLLLLLIVIALGYFMTQALTYPLDIIRNHLRNTSLAGTNEPIEWYTKDEIGKLVDEYNSMIIALKESVERLAQSEREGAWREMAKQVAHEIKNPLTPMKLQLQRLQMSFHDHSADFNSQFEKVSGIIIRQIETLSQIATEFSNFAKMPQGEPKLIELNDMLHEISQLFDQENDVEMSFSPAPQKLYLMADPQELNRVFTNIVKNATQAIPADRKGRIELSCQREDGFIRIKVHDNGTGIPLELRKKIFMPNFSTKTAGMGLGLAIVKSIIEKAGGSIYFETQEGEGTTFIILLPEVKPAEELVDEEE